MEETSIIISGFGGQGTLFAGQVLAYAALDNGLEVTWIPSYGPEMRGGTAHCTVIIGDEPIGSPLVRNPDVVLALNLPSVDKYEYLVPEDGLLVANGIAQAQTSQAVVFGHRAHDNHVALVNQVDGRPASIGKGNISLVQDKQTISTGI